MKLNLGCGNKLYLPVEGFINVDIVDPTVRVVSVDVITNETTVNEGGAPMFLQSDLMNLHTVDDEVADEIHAYHIIEHFFRSEVPHVLKEWHRVLKVGGVIALEQPDVLKCAANFITGMTRGDGTLIHNLGILGFYGDGTPDEPYMGHKWGWYPDSLAQELVKAGFDSVTVEPAQTHMKDVRDFRLVAKKEKTT